MHVSLVNVCVLNLLSIGGEFLGAAKPFPYFFGLKKTWIFYMWRYMQASFFEVLMNWKGFTESINNPIPSLENWWDTFINSLHCVRLSTPTDEQKHSANFSWWSSGLGHLWVNRWEATEVALISNAKKPRIHVNIFKGICLLNLF